MNKTTKIKEKSKNFHGFENKKHFQTFCQLGNFLKKSKKAIISFNMLMYLTKIIFLLIVSTTIIFFVSIILQPDIQTEQLESELFIARTFYSPTGISYFNPLTNKIEPGIIDETKFNQDTINNLFNYGTNNHLGAKLTLNQQEIIYNSKIYREGVKRVDFKLIKKSVYVLIKKDGELIPSKLDFEIMIKNE